MKTEEYYKICKEFDNGSLFSDCFKNEFFPDYKDTKRLLAGGSTDDHHWFTKTKDLKTECSDGYCPCDAAD